MKQPLYQQIIDYLQNEIDSGRLPVGAQVPTEKNYRLSLTSVEYVQTTLELETQGVIQRHQGKRKFCSSTKASSSYLFK